MTSALICMTPDCPRGCSRGPPKVLQLYTNADIVLRLPAGLKVQDMKWLSIWCRRFTVSTDGKSRLLLGNFHTAGEKSR